MNNQADQNKYKKLRARIRARKGLIGCGDRFSAALHSLGKVVYTGTDRWGQEEARSWSGVVSMSCGRDYIMALMDDGTLRVAGKGPVEPSELDRLSCVRALAAGQSHIAALLGNGHTVAMGDNRYGQCNTANWPAMADLICGKNFTAGIAKSGQVYIVGGSHTLRLIVRSWQNIIGIFTDDTGTNIYAINYDGRLIANVPLPSCTKNWRNLVSVAVHGNSMWGVSANGQLYSTDERIKDLNPQVHYISCAVCGTHAMALTRDGQVLSVGENDFGQCNTVRFGTLYADFDEFSTDRNERNDRMKTQERQYQTRLADANRYKRRIACGKRITVCINAEGRVLTTANFAESQEWNQVRAIACGNAHVVALHENGQVSADGNNVDGCTNVSQWRHVKAVAAGKYHSLGVTYDGSVYFCGRNDNGQGDVTEWNQINRIATTENYTVGVAYDGTILIAGTPPFDPKLVDQSWKNPVSMVATPTHLACLYADGTVKTTSPKFSTDRWRGVRTIAAGRDLTLGLCYGGRVLSAGLNNRGQCNTADWKHIVDIGCGDGYAVGLTADGHMQVAGEIQQGSRGGWLLLRTSDATRWAGVMAFRCGSHHLVALSESGQILACGEDEDGQCSATTHFAIFRDVRQLYGYGQYGRHLEQELQAQRAAIVHTAKKTANSMSSLTPWEAARSMRGKFAIGMAHTVLLDEKGTVETRGANDCGQRDLIAYETATQVAAGPYRSAAILSDGRIVMAGRNSDGQGDAQALNLALEWETLPIKNRSVWVQVACGHSHTVALRSDGRVFAVGANTDGRCETSPWRDVCDVCCGIRHTVARKSDGTCVATGDNRYGQCEVTDWKDTAMIAAGEFHTAALLSDGRVVAVGDNRKGQCDVEDLTDVVSVACLPETTLCVCSDGRVVIRGGSGELNQAVEALQDVVALSVCEHRVAAMTAEQELILIP